LERIPDRGCYSLDWNQAWLSWVDREVEKINKCTHRRRAYFERLSA
jgi:hypothetical protein